jgi:hypothetical protein
MTYQTNKYIASLSDKNYSVKEYEIGKYIILNRNTKEDFYASHEEISSMSIDKIEHLRISSYNPDELDFMEDINNRL